MTTPNPSQSIPATRDRSLSTPIPPAASTSGGSSTTGGGTNFQLPRDRRVALLQHLRKIKQQSTNQPTTNHSNTQPKNHPHPSSSPPASVIPPTELASEDYIQREEEEDSDPSDPSEDDEDDDDEPEAISPQLLYYTTPSPTHSTQSVKIPSPYALPLTPSSQHIPRLPTQRPSISTSISTATASSNNVSTNSFFPSSACSPRSPLSSSSNSSSSVPSTRASFTALNLSPSSATSLGSSPEVAPIPYSLVPVCPLRREELLAQSPTFTIRDFCTVCESAGQRVPIGLHPGSESSRHEPIVSMRSYDEELSRAGADRASEEFVLSARSPSSANGGQMGRSSFSLPHTTRRPSFSYVTPNVDTPRSPHLTNMPASSPTGMDELKEDGPNRRTSISRSVSSTSSSTGSYHHPPYSSRAHLTQEQLEREEKVWYENV